MPQLNTYVHVLDETGQTREFGPDDQLPEWAINKITNPDVWADAPAHTPETSEPAPAADEVKPEPVKRTARRSKAGS
ncbi:hypothetical protein IU485_28000 [Nocardia cyriacigeorgica]|uniref:hypothetical protein n=1 Tax=Nocardia cyriacigeorgica TaxID=135487 RepID=UPI001895C9CA|nr:hypothetical protein [Nocardia cyriacigeorgica]MBF6085216.1 hypothetical protein [Nocardia cyriacigeorgica]